MFSSMVWSSAVVEASATVPPPPPKPPDPSIAASLLTEPPVPPVPPEPPPLVSSHSLLAFESPLAMVRSTNLCSLFSEVLCRREGSTVLRQKFCISSWLCSSNSTGLVLVTYWASLDLFGTGFSIGIIVSSLNAHPFLLSQVELPEFALTRFLPFYEAIDFYLSLPLDTVPLPQYEVSLPLYEDVTQIPYAMFVKLVVLLVLVLYESGLHFSKVGDDTTNTNLGCSVSDLAGWMQMFSSQFTGSSSRCLFISVAKFLAASFALVAEACSGNVSPSVTSHSQDFISLSNLDGFNSIGFNVMFVSIFYDYVFYFTFGITVFSASLAIVLGVLNNCSMFGD